MDKIKHKHNSEDQPASQIMGKSNNFRKGKSGPQKELLSDLSYMKPAPRYLVVKRADGDFNKVSPFRIQKEFSDVIGDLKSIRKIREGLLVETRHSAQSTNLLGMKMFLDFQVTVEPHRSLNYSRGVITCPDLLNCSTEEILDGLKSQNVTDVKRITTMRDGVRQDSASCILTFECTELPERVKAGFHSLPVRPYIPAPMRCYRCQRYGHTSARCNNDETCICGLAPHEGQPCQKPFRCVNCGLEHSAISKNCEVYKTEAAIQSLKLTEKLSYGEAKRKYLSRNLNGRSTFAQVTATTPLLQSKNLEELASLLASQLVCLLQDKPEVSTLPTPRNWSHVPAAILPPVHLENNIPTSVLRRHASSSKTGGTVSNPQNTDVPSRQKTTQEIEENVNRLIRSIDHSSVCSPITSGNEGRASTRGRSSSDSTTNPPKKRATKNYNKPEYSDSDSDSNYNKSIFEAKPNKTTEDKKSLKPGKNKPRKQTV